MNQVLLVLFHQRLNAILVCRNEGVEESLGISRNGARQALIVKASCKVFQCLLFHVFQCLLFSCLLSLNLIPTDRVSV